MAAQAEVMAVGIYDEIRKLGYECDHDFNGGSEEHMEVWVNRKTGMGVAIEWFRLPELAR